VALIFRVPSVTFWLNMPTVLRQDGFRVMIYPHDHNPAHVHVYKGDGVAVIKLGPVMVRDFVNLGKNELRRAVLVIEAHQDELLQRWREIHAAE
jgi:hypothetical protein